jgi:hypothetical protein
MGPARADHTQFVSDDEWDLRPGEEAGLPFGLEEMTPTFANGAATRYASILLRVSPKRRASLGGTRSPVAGRMSGRSWTRGSKRCVARRGVRGSAPSAISRPQGCSGAAIEQYRAGSLFNKHIAEDGPIAFAHVCRLGAERIVQSGWTADIDPVGVRPGSRSAIPPASLCSESTARTGTGEHPSVQRRLSRHRRYSLEVDQGCGTNSCGCRLARCKSAAV